MNVYKFGGASVKDAEGVKNLFKIINTQRENLIIVVSAMGKMTDALEVLCNSYFGKTGNIAEVFQRIQDFHQQIIRDLFGSADSEVNARVEALYQELDTILKSDPSLCYDYEYDRIICFGELLSTTIIAAYLEKQISNYRLSCAGIHSIFRIHLCISRRDSLPERRPIKRPPWGVKVRTIPQPFWPICWMPKMLPFGKTCPVL